MPRLFVVADLPDAVTADLVRLQPPPARGVRLPAPDQMHLTLHYLGEVDLERAAASLGEIALPSFPVTFEGVGRFPTAGGSVTLWAGVKAGDELLELHEAVAAALSRDGFRSDARRYTPHVSVARCELGVPAGVVDDFLTRNASFTMPAVTVAGFGLYSSAFVVDAPVYRRERSFPLR